VIVAIDGKSGWFDAPDPKTGQPTLIDLQGNDMAAAQFEAWRDPDLILLKATDASAKLVPQPDEKIDGKDQAVVNLQSPFGTPGVVIYIDKKTKLVTRMSYTDMGQTATDDFADYRDVNGFKIAFKRTSDTQGRATALQLDKVELDGTIDATVFKKPA